MGRRFKIEDPHYPLTHPQCQHYDTVNREYNRNDVIVIHKARDTFGRLLNMSNQFGVTINSMYVRNAEAAYQLLRYPNMPRVQRHLIDEPSPLMAKRWSLQFRDYGRESWYYWKVPAMRWVLRAKLACNYEEMGTLLEATGEKIILETSPDGNFWGGIPRDKHNPNSPLWGANIFGQLLMELRHEYRTQYAEEMLVVKPLDIPDFLLLGEQIRTIDCRK